MSEVKVNKISPRSGTTVTLGDSGDTFTVPSGATFDASNATTTLPSTIVTTTGSQTLTNKTIDASQLTGTITPSDNTVSLAKLTATGTKDATTFLRGDNTFASPSGGTNTPAFLAYLGSTQTPTNDAYNIVQNDTEVFDTDSCYDTGTYKFTPTTSGKYFIYACTWMQSNSDEAKFQHTNIEKNGSTYLARTTIDFRNTAGRAISCFVSTVTEMNGTTDYLRVSTFPNFLNSNTTFVSGQQNTFFGGYKIIE